MTSDQLVKKIEESWLDASYPEGDGLTVHLIGLDEVFYQGLVGKSWDSLSSSFLNHHSDCIGLLTPKGFQYFLPAFLISDLKLGGNTMIRSCLFWTLEGCLGGYSSIKGLSGPDWFRTRIGQLTSQQKVCVVEFIDTGEDGDLDNYEFIVEHIMN